MREPQTMRLSRSRPRWSDPRRKPADSGTASRRPGWVRLGSARGSTGARSATATITDTMTAPISTDWLPSRRPIPSTRRARDRPPATLASSAFSVPGNGRTLRVPDTRVDARVEEIGHEVDHDVAGRDEQHASLDEGEVAGQDRIDHHEADAGPAEDDLHVDGAREQESHLQAD